MNTKLTKTPTKVSFIMWYYSSISFYNTQTNI